MKQKQRKVNQTYKQSRQKRNYFQKQKLNSTYIFYLK